MIHIIFILIQPFRDSVLCMEAAVCHISPLNYSDCFFNFTHLHSFHAKLEQQCYILATRWSIEFDLNVCVCVCAVPVRWRSKDRHCGFCSGGAGSGHPAADQGTHTPEISL